MAIESMLLDYINTTTVIIGVTVFLVIWWLRQPRDLPPGPWGLPVVGMIPFFSGLKEEDKALNIYRKYGPVSRYSVGSLKFVLFGDYQATKESFIQQGDNFAGKAQEMMKVKDSDSGIGILEGDAWKEHRRFILSTFRDFGMGKLSLEPRITEEIHCFLEILKKEKGQPYNLKKMLGISVANVICSMEFGNRFEYDDPEFLRLRDLTANSAAFIQILMLRITFPWMKLIPFFDYFSGWNELLKFSEEFYGFYKKKIDEHRKVYEEGSRRDLIDAFLTEKNIALRHNRSLEVFTDEVLTGTLDFLFFAGAETIVMTINWALAILVNHPEIMAKIQKEIDNVIGMERNPSISDRLNMVYFEAFMQEVHRYASIAPVLMHNNLETTTVMGYRIPKRSLATCSLYSIHHDPKLWKDPEVFRPERFLDDKGRVLKPEYFLAFGAGKRNCIGESLARMELFLYLTSLLQRFELQIPEGETISLETITSFLRDVKPYKLCFIPRTI